MFCPNYKNQTIKAGFNEMIQAFGGRAMTDEEFRDGDLRNQRTGRDWSAMEAAYKIYNKSGGLFLDKVPNSVSEDFPNGKDSMLFKSLLDNFNGDRNKAIVAKANLFSDAFKQWFGDWINNLDNASKAVDLNGEPLVFYHGTENNFDVFEIDEDGSKGGHHVHDRHSFFFTDTYKKAFKYKHAIVMPVFLSMKNPGISDVRDGTYKSINEYTDNENNIIRDDKFDSAIFVRYDKEGDNHGIIPTTQWVVKLPTQIKSITNNGNFNKFDPNIHNKQVDLFQIKDELTNRFIPSLLLSYQNLIDDQTISSRSMIEDMLSQGAISSSNVLLAQILSKHDIPIKIDNSLNNTLATSITDKNNNSIILINMNLARQVSLKYFSQTVLHEIIHSVTTNAINNPKTEQQNRFKRLNSKAYNILISNIRKNGPSVFEPGSSLENALLDEHEFASEFATDLFIRNEVCRIAKQMDSRHNVLTKTFMRLVNALSDIFINRHVIGNVADILKYQNTFKDYLTESRHISTKSKITINLLISRYKSLNQNVLISELIVELNNLLNRDINSLLVHNKLWRVIRLDDTKITEEKQKIDPSSAYDNILRALRSRQDALRTASINNADKAASQNSVASQIALFSTAEISKYVAISSFVQQVSPQLLEDVKKIRNIKNNDLNPSAHVYMYQMHGNVGVYKNIFDTLSSILNETDNLEQIVNEYNKSLNKENQISVDDVILLRELVIKSASVANTGVMLLQAISAKIAANEARNLALDIGAYDLYEYANTFFNSSKINDISSRELYLGASDSSSNLIIRLVSHIVAEANNKAEIDTFPVLLKLQELKSKLSSGESLLDLYEYDENGLTTGYLVRDINFGKYYKDYDNYIINLNRVFNKLFKLDLSDFNRVLPDDDTKVKITLTAEQSKLLGYGEKQTIIETSLRLLWNTARNKWLSEHGERKYINKYYEIQASLPLLAKRALDQYDAQIQSILQIQGIVDEFGNRHYDLLTEDQYRQLELAVLGKKWLYSTKDQNGKDKTGPELEIAKSLIKYREDLNLLRELQIYKKTGKKPDKRARFEQEYDTEHWKLAFDAKIEECGGKDAFEKWFSGKENSGFNEKVFTKWIRRNGRLLFRKDEGHDMWKDILDRLRADEINYGKEYDDLKQQLDELLNPLKDKYGEVNPEDMSEALRNTILNILFLMWSIQRLVSASNPNIQNQRERHKQIADQFYTFTDTEQYKQIQAQLVEMFSDPETGEFDEISYDQALLQYSYVFSADQDYISPFKWLTRIEAKDKLKYMLYVPNEAWIKRSEDTYLINDNYNDKYNTYVIPKRQLYDNTKAFLKVTNGSLAMKDFYDYACKIISEANDMQSNRLYTDDYQLPQQTGSLWKRLKNSNHKLSVLYDWVKEQFGGSEDQQARLMYGKTDALDFMDSEGNVTTRDDKLYGRYPDGRVYNTLPQYYTRKLSDPSQLSSDLIGMLQSYYNMSLRYKNKLAIRDSVETLVDAISNQQFRRGDNTVKGDQSRTFLYLNDWLLMNLYDTTRILKSFRIPGTKTKICFDKTLSLARRTVTALNLGLNPKVAFVGFTTSSLTNLVWSIVGLRYGLYELGLSIKDVAFRVFKKFTTSTKSIRNPLSNDKMLVIMERLNSSGQYELKSNHTNRNRFVLFLYENSTYGFLSGLDWLSKSSIVQNVIRAHRCVDGEFITKYDLKINRYILGEDEYKRKMKLFKSAKTLWDCIDTSTGDVKIKGGEEYEKAFNESRNKIRHRCKKYPEEADGMATSLQRALLIRSWVGVFVALHRQYLPLMLDKYYGKRVYDYDMLEYKNGIHRNFFNFLCNICGANYFVSGALFGSAGLMFLSGIVGLPWLAFFLSSILGIAANKYVRHRNKKLGIETKGLKDSIKQFFFDNSSREAYQKSLMNRYQLKQTLIEVSLYQVVSFLADAACAWADDDDDSAWWKYMIAYIARATQWEYFTPYRTDDLLNNIKSATAATSLSDKVSNAFTGIGRTALNTMFPRLLLDPFEIVDNIEQKSDVIGKQSRSYEGWTRTEKYLFQLLPIHNVWEQYRDSKSKLGYNENQIQHNPRKESNSLYYTIFGHNESDKNQSKVNYGL